MNGQELERNLRSIGKECFVTFFEEFCDLTRSNENVAAQIEKGRGYTEKSCRSRASHARSIIKARRAMDALNIIRLSTSPKVTSHIKERTVALAARFRSSQSHFR